MVKYFVLCRHDWPKFPGTKLFYLTGMNLKESFNFFVKPPHTHVVTFVVTVIIFLSANELKKKTEGTIDVIGGSNSLSKLINLQ